MAIPTKKDVYRNEPIINKGNIKIQPEQKPKKAEIKRKQLDINRANYILSTIKQHIESVPDTNIEALNRINSETLQNAPEWFFDKYRDVCALMTEDIQNAISNGDNSGLVSKIKRDPTNKQIKEQVYMIILQEFIRIESSSLTSKYGREYSEFDDIDKKILQTMIVNEICGLGPLEPLFNDTKIREIMCNGPYDIQIEIDGKCKKVPSCKFRDGDHLQSLVTKLFASVNKEVSRSHPSEKARLHDNSRVKANHEVIAPGGPTLNIRRHTEQWLPPAWFVQQGSISVEAMEWLGQHINAGLNFLVVGGTSAGKTTLLGSLTGFYENDLRLLTGEDNIELKGAPNKLWGLPMETVPKKANSSSEGFSMRDIVVAMTQMRPDGIIIGEITGAEAWDMLVALNTGHFGGTTTHGNSAREGVDKIVQLASQAEVIKGDGVYRMVASAFDIVINITKSKKDGKRRVMEICEVGMKPIKNAAGEIELPVYPIWRFVQNETHNSSMIITGRWEKVGELSPERRDRHNLDFTQMKTINELKELYTNDVA